MRQGHSRDGARAFVLVAIAAVVGCDAATTSPSAPVGPFLASAVRACPWQAACADESLDSCVANAARDDAYMGEIPPGTWQGLADCAARATSCDEYLACREAAEGERAAARQAALEGVECRAGVVLCRGDTLVACEEGADDDDHLLRWVIDCAAVGLVCADETCRDASPTACSGDEVCEGPFVVLCQGGKTAHYDCRQVDPAFVCFDDDGQKRCGLPEDTWACDGHSQGGTCEGTVARTCVWGKVVDTDCAAVPGGRCEADGLWPRCVVE